MQRPQEFIGVSYAGRGIYVKKPPTWDDLLRTVSQRFQLSYAAAASLRALYSSDMSGTSPRWEMDASAWAGVKPDSSIYLESDESVKEEAEDTGPPDENTGILDVRNRIHDRINVAIMAFEPNPTLYLAVKRTLRFEKVMCCLSERLDLPLQDFRCFHGGHRLQPNDTFDSVGIEDGDIIEVRRRVQGGKPAIYLLSSVSLQVVKVSVILRPEWDFSVLYPFAPMTKSVNNSTSTVSWTVSVQPDGTLTHHSTGRQSSYLFWEARGLLSSTPRLLSAGHHDPAFDPSNPMVFFEPWHVSVAVPFDRLEPYLDSILQSLTLTPAMRTEFIVYWLPSFQRIRDKGQDIRFTFVPQEAFNKAAELKIEGAIPKAVARVFMLFGGVENQEPRDLDADYQPGNEDGYDIDWPGVIGLDIWGMKDEAAFRVLEWGGMEVPTVFY
ncbi:hypothetical protein DL764_004254 [Monosporascus ibericus]|uniref:Ubiquitin-like domain-containing protein n=1 Tax=Monosporascus ibericus TaxID=155417 RepID=A0A4Q4TFZ2_9PEZI|nr:hypothetical protein DL764_004254 [Monosporascus ibericus]